MKCDGCGFRIRFLQDAEKVSREEDQPCDQCGCVQLKVTYSAAKSPFPGGRTMYTGCLLCDTNLSSTIVNLALKEKKEAGEEEEKEGKQKRKRNRAKNKLADRTEQEQMNDFMKRMVGNNE